MELRKYGPETNNNKEEKDKWSILMNTKMFGSLQR